MILGVAGALAIRDLAALLSLLPGLVDLLDRIVFLDDRVVADDAAGRQGKREQTQNEQTDQLRHHRGSLAGPPRGDSESFLKWLATRRNYLFGIVITNR